MARAQARDRDGGFAGARGADSAGVSVGVSLGARRADPAGVPLGARLARFALLALLALALAGAGCAQAPQPQPVARKSAGAPAGAVAKAGAAAAAPAATGAGAGAAPTTPATPPTPPNTAAAPGVAGGAAPAGSGMAGTAAPVGGMAGIAASSGAVGTAAPAGAPGNPGSAGSSGAAGAVAPALAAAPPVPSASAAPPASPGLSGSDNSRAVADAKEAGGSSSGAGQLVSPNAGVGGAPPTGAQGKTTLPGKLEHPEHVVVIDDGTSDVEKPKTLVEAAKAEKARRAKTHRAAIVINDKNLHKYAAKGSLTVATPKKSAAPAAAAPNGHDEQFWRRGVLEIRLRLRRATDRVKELEQAAGDWRRRFYAQDDPYVRDGQIKPAWDRVLDELRQAKTEIDVSRRELEDFLDQGRREGALPGWLREGIEQEPPPPPKPASKTLEAIEPPILKDPPTLDHPQALR